MCQFPYHIDMQNTSTEAYLRGSVQGGDMKKRHLMAALEMRELAVMREKLELLAQSVMEWSWLNRAMADGFVAGGSLS